MLSKQLQDQIEQEAASDASSYGYEPGHEIDEDLQSVYRYAAGKYAALYEAAAARAERAEKALTKIVVISCNGDHRSTILEIKSIASMAVAKNQEALTPKTGEDE